MSQSISANSTSKPNEQVLQSQQVQSFLNQLDQTLWKSADKLRNNLDAANYKHIVLGFIFLKYVSDTFTAHREQLRAQFQNPDHELYLDPEFFDAKQLNSELEQRDTPKTTSFGYRKKPVGMQSKPYLPPTKAMNCLGVANSKA